MIRTLRAGAALAALIAGLAGCGGSQSRTDVAQRAPVAGWRTWVLASPHAVAVPRRPAVHLAKTPRGDRRWTGPTATEPWLRLNLQLVARGGVDPPRAARGYALTSVAMYDAVVASAYWRDHRRGTTTAPSADAAVAGAASRVLAYLFPRPGRGHLDRLAERAAASRAGIGREAAAGLALGRAVAARVIARARTDGSARRWHGRVPAGRATWHPAPGTHSSPADPLAGTWRTWVLRSGSQFRPAPPPRFGSPRFLREARELIRLHARLTPEQQRTAYFWAGGVGSPLPPGVWNEVALAYVRRDRLDTAAAARVLALLNIAQADTGVATWDAKYAYWGPRPKNAIRALGLARHWRPFLATPPFPGYVSAHSAFSGAASEVLAALFPRDARRFRAKAVEAGISRLYGGIHFPADHDAGLALGRRVGRLVLRRAGLAAVGTRKKRR